MSKGSSGRKINRREQIVGIFGLLLSFLVMWEGVSQGIGTVRYPGAGFLPFLAAGVLGLLAVTTIVRSSFGFREDGTIKGLWKDRKWSKVILGSVSLIVYSAVLSRLGYLLATFGLTLLLFGLIERPRFSVQLASAFLATVLTYLVFYTWLGVQLPRGVFGF